MSEFSLLAGALAIIMASVTAIIYKFVRTTQAIREANRLAIERVAQKFTDLTRHELEKEIEERINDAIKLQEIKDNAKK